MRRMGIRTVAALWLSAGLSAQAAYRTETVVKPGQAPHQYLVEIKVTDVQRDGRTDVLTAPKLVVKAGEEGRIVVGDAKGENGVFCTALVRETAVGLEALTTIVVKEKGAEKLNTAQTILLKQ
jgi:hypothetical protein